MPWGAVRSATQLTAIDTTEQFFDEEPVQGSPIFFDDARQIHARVVLDFPASGAVDALVSVYPSIAATPDFDSEPFLRRRIPGVDGTVKSFSFVMTGVFQFRVGVMLAETGTALDSADLSYRVGRV